MTTMCKANFCTCQMTTLGQKQENGWDMCCTIEKNQRANEMKKKSGSQVAKEIYVIRLVDKTE